MPYFISTYVSSQVWFLHLLLLLYCAYTESFLHASKFLTARTYSQQVFLRNSLTLMGIFIHKRLLPKIYSCLEAFSNVTNNGYWSCKHTCLRIYKGGIFLQPPNRLQLWHQFSLQHFQEPCSFILPLRGWQLEFHYYLGGLTVRMSIRKKKKSSELFPRGNYWGW